MPLWYNYFSKNKLKKYFFNLFFYSTALTFRFETRSRIKLKKAHRRTVVRREPFLILDDEIVQMWKSTSTTH